MTTKALDRLEKKVRLLVEALEEAREQNVSLRRRLEARGKNAGDDAVPQEAPASPSPPSGRAGNVERQLELLQEERAAIRDRVERAISMIEEAR